MKRILSTSFLIIILLLFVNLVSRAQDVTGIWKGYFITEGGDQYKLEFQVEQNKATLTVTGVSYSYLDVRFYGKATMTGNFNKEDQKFRIQELRTVEVRNLGGGGTCLMNYNLNYSKSGREEFLEGSYLGKSEDRKNPQNNGKWGDCGTGTVYLHKVTTSDFYVEPFLRDKPELKRDTSETRKSPIVKTTAPKTTQVIVKKNPPRANPPVVRKNTPTTGRSTNKPIVKADTVTKIVTQPQVKNPVTTQKTTVITPSILKDRQNALAQAVTVNVDSITIKLYDNGEIDGDTISIFVDNRLVLSHKGLSTVPIVLPLRFELDGAEHEVVMVAENLGRIPPNTSLMIVYAGDKRYQVQITSTEQKNAMVRFRYVKPH